MNVLVSNQLNGYQLNKVMGKWQWLRTAACNASLSVLAVATMMPAVSYADTIFGLHGSAHIWQPDLGGNIGQSDDAFDFSSEFKDGSGDSVSLLFAVEHPVPLVPNVQLRLTPMNWEGNSDSARGSLGGTVVFNGETQVKTDVDMLDGTLYYELLDNWVSLDLGLTARQFKGFVEARERDGTRSDRVDINQIFPMLYGHARFDLPFSGLAAGVRGNGIAYSDNNLLDLEAYLHLEVDLIPLFDIGIQGGVRRLSVEIDDIDDWSSDAAFNGTYIAVTGHF